MTDDHPSHSSGDQPLDTTKESTGVAEPEQAPQEPAQEDGVHSSKTLEAVAPPLQEVARSPAAETMPNSPGIIVLQWLTYAFWGWTLLAIIWLVYIVFANYILGSDQTAVIPYAIAATLVLLPLSVVCDFFFGRKETVKKTGVATVVMVIHAVLFALFGIGVLIAAVFTLVQLSVGSITSDKQAITLLATLLVSTFFYGVTFLRTLNPTPKLKIGLIYRVGMLLIVGLLIVLAFIGPVARSWATRDDREVVMYMPDVSSAVNEYVREKKALPASLGDVELSEEAKALVDRGLVTYKADGKETTIDQQSEQQDMSSVAVESFVVATDYKYQLCTTYKEASGEADRESRGGSSVYDDYLYVSDHPAGEICYKLKVSVND